MFVTNPIVLVHKYTQAMLTPLSWITPKSVLALGLGAGSIHKYLMHYFPEATIDTVELRASVINVAKEYFSLPSDNVNLNIIHSSAQEYLKQSAEPAAYDLILIDLFLTTSNKTDINIGLNEYFDALYERLTVNGCLCINIIGSDYFKYPGYASLMKAFSNNVYVSPVDSTNTVIFAFRAPVNMRHQDTQLSYYELKYGLHFRQYLNKLQPARLV